MNMQTNESLDADVRNNAEKNSESNSRLIGGVTILGLSGISAIIAGVITAHLAKKKSNELLKELGKEHMTPVVSETPYAIAFRALAWGTVWAVGGCSLIAFGLWKWYGFKDLEDFRARARSNIKKSKNPNERTEFESLRDFLNYLNETSKAKSTKTS